MKRHLVLGLGALVALSGAAIAQQAGQTVSVGAIRVEAPWTRATPGGARVAGGFMKITNTGSTPDRLVSGSADVSARFEVHEMAVIDGVMKMRELAKGLDIAPGATVELKPGGYHVMFIDLKKPIAQGDIVRATLVFEKAGKVDVSLPASAIGAPAAGGQGGHGKH